MSKKNVFKYFTITEWEKEEAYLRAMHGKGWRFERVSFPGIYQFDECEPEDVVYRLDYDKDSEKEWGTYTKLFEDCGWEYVTNFMGYSYFRKHADAAREEDNEIFDDAAKMEMCNRVFKGRMLPMLCIFCVCLLPQIVMNYSRMMDGDTDGKVFFFMFAILMALYLWIFISFAYHYLKMRKRFS